jgi:uncharacterized protein (DUF1330 family)
MDQQATKRELISQIRFSRHGARLLARGGHHGYAAQYRKACRNRIAELRVLRASGSLVNELEGN